MRTSSESSSTVQWVCGPTTATCRPSTGPGGRTTGAGWRWWPVSSPRTDLPPATRDGRGDSRGERAGGSGRGQPGVVVAHGAAVGEQRAVVVEEDDAVAQQA